MTVHVMTHATSLLAGFALSRLLDRRRRRRRRRRRAVDTGAHDVRPRSRGVLRALRGRRREVPDDAGITERVRARLASVASDPAAIQVTSREGTVTLRGPILADEIPTVVRAVAAVRDVVAVDDLLEAHLEPAEVPGVHEAPAPRRASAPSHGWSPTRRLVAGGAGTIAAAWGLTRTTTVGAVTAAAGLVLLARAVTNEDMRRLFVLGGARDAVMLQNTIVVRAPIDDVWDLWSGYEALPTFMSHVRSVHRADDGSSYWTVEGPGGMPINWQTVETRRVPRETLAWKTVAGAPVAHAGMVQLAATSGGTRIHVRLRYTPPASAAGPALAAILGPDPKRAMDEDLVRFKSLVEDRA
jgi:uncharacterized membrane protein